MEACYLINAKNINNDDSGIISCSDVVWSSVTVIYVLWLLGNYAKFNYCLSFDYRGCLAGGIVR